MTPSERVLWSWGNLTQSQPTSKTSCRNWTSASSQGTYVCGLCAPQRDLVKAMALCWCGQFVMLCWRRQQCCNPSSTPPPVTPSVRMWVKETSTWLRGEYSAWANKLHILFCVPSILCSCMSLCMCLYMCLCVWMCVLVCHSVVCLSSQVSCVVRQNTDEPNSLQTCGWGVQTDYYYNIACFIQHMPTDHYWYTSLPPEPCWARVLHHEQGDVCRGP